MKMRVKGIEAKLANTGNQIMRMENHEGKIKKIENDLYKLIA